MEGLLREAGIAVKLLWKDRGFSATRSSRLPSAWVSHGTSVRGEARLVQAALRLFINTGIVVRHFS